MGGVTRYGALFVPDDEVVAGYFERGHTAYPVAVEVAATSTTDDGKLADALEAVARALRYRAKWPPGSDGAS
jgi:hypothetical protein